MLQVKGIEFCSPVKVEFDPYIAVKIIFDSASNLDATAYWNFGTDEQFIEVGAAENLGTIRKITLVLIKKISLEDKIFAGIPLMSGIPVFARPNYDRNLIFDEAGPLEMFVGTDKLHVLFSDNPICSGLVCDRVTCLLDKDNNFCGFEVANITSNERKVLEDNFINRKFIIEKSL